MDVSGIAVPFNETAIGALLELTADDTTLQTAGIVDVHRSARSLYGIRSGVARVEFYIYSPDGSNPSLNDAVYLGICTAQAGLSGYVGEDAYGWAYHPYDGKVYNDGAVVATFAAAPLRSYINVICDATNNQVMFFAGTEFLGALFDMPADALLFYAASIAGAPGALAVQANAGQWPEHYPFPTLPGWLHFATGITPCFFASEPYISAPTDAQPHQKYAGDIAAGTEFGVARRLRFWPQGASADRAFSAGGAQVQIPISDPYNRAAQLLRPTNTRNQLVTILRTLQGEDVASAETLFTGVLDHGESTGLYTRMLYCGGKQLLLQQQPRRAHFAPDDDPSVAGKPRPFLLGGRRTIRPPLQNADTLTYAISDAAISAVGKLCDSGRELALGIDVFLTPDAKGFIRAAAPTGTFTVEATDYGGAISTTSTDALSGDGDFSLGGHGGGLFVSTSSIAVGTGNKGFNIGTHTGLAFFAGSTIAATSRTTGASMTGTYVSYAAGVLTINVTATTGAGSHADWDIRGGINQPTGWVGNGGPHGSESPTQANWQVAGAGSAHYVQQQQVAAAVFNLVHSTFMCDAGASYALKIQVSAVPYFGPSIDPVTGEPVMINPARLNVGGWSNGNNQFAFWATHELDAPGAFTLYFTNRYAIAMPLVITYICNALINGDPSVGLRITNIGPLVALPALTQNVELDMPPLARILRQLLIEHGPLGDSDFDEASAAAIDDATGYTYGVYASPDDTPNIDDLAKRVLDSCCACLYDTRDGKIAVARMRSPGDDVPVIMLGPSDFATVPDITPDLAENLTTRIAGGQNVDKLGDGDFSNVSTDDVPLTRRRQLEADYQWTVASGAALAPMYASARHVSPLASAFDVRAHGEAEASRIGDSLYSDDRYLVRVQVFTPPGRVLELDQVAVIIDPTQPLLADGREMILHGIADALDQNKADCLFWG